MPSAGRKVALMRQLEQCFRVYPCGFAPAHTASCCLAAQGRFVEQPRGMDFSQYVGWMTDTCRRIPIDAVLPVRDGDMDWLNAMRGQFETMGVPLILSPARTIRIARDKLLMSKQLQGLAPRTVPVSEWASLGHDFPLFAKERQGAGSRVAQKVHTPRELGAMAIEHADLIVQPWLSGCEYTVDLFYPASGSRVSSCCRRRISVSEGQMDCGEVVPMPEPVIESLMEVDALLDLFGPVNMQFIVDGDGKAWLTDINLRFGGGTPLSIRAGLDSVRRLANMILGEDRHPTGDPIATGTRAISYIEYIFKEPER